MTQPRITALALLPSPVRIGEAWLRPLTLGGLILLHGLKSPFVEGAATPEPLEVFAAGYILSQPYAVVVGEHQRGDLGRNAVHWAKQNGVDCDQLTVLIIDMIRDGYSSHAQTGFPVQAGTQIQEENEYGNGVGELLTLLERTCFNYRWTREYVLASPLITLLALNVTRRIAEGAEWREFNYFERDLDLGALKADLAAKLAAAQAGMETTDAG